MNLLTNGFVDNSGRLFGPSEQFEADIVELGLQGFAGAALSVARLGQIIIGSGV